MACYLVIVVPWKITGHKPLVVRKWFVVSSIYSINVCIRNVDLCYVWNCTKTTKNAVFVIPKDQKPGKRCSHQSLFSRITKQHICNTRHSKTRKAYNNLIHILSYSYIIKISFQWILNFLHFEIDGFFVVFISLNCVLFVFKQ